MSGAACVLSEGGRDERTQYVPLYCDDVAANVVLIYRVTRTVLNAPKKMSSENFERTLRV